MPTEPLLSPLPFPPLKCAFTEIKARLIQGAWFCSHGQWWRVRRITTRSWESAPPWKLKAVDYDVLLLQKQHWGMWQSCTSLQLATSHQEMMQKPGSIHIFSTYTSKNGSGVLFFDFPSALICFNPLTLLTSLTANSFFTNETSVLSGSSQFSVPVAGLKMLQVSAWITRRQKTSQISCLFMVGLISSPLEAKHISSKLKGLEKITLPD